MDAILKSLLEQVSDLHGIPVGAYNIRNNGQSESRNSTDTIQPKMKVFIFQQSLQKQASMI